MKKILFFITSILCCMNMQAQMTKIHTSNTYPYHPWANIGVYQFGPAYSFFEGNTIYSYNWDFSLNKAITITRVPEDYVFGSVLSVSQKCINNDDKWEIIVAYRAQNVNNQYPECNENCKVLIINEDNELIQDLGFANSAGSSGFHKNANEVRCLMYKFIKNEDDELVSYYDIYRCAGNGGDIVVNEITANTIEPAYPNPTYNTITIPYSMNGNQASEMHIYDIQGRLVKTIQVGPHFNEVNVDVSSFPSGTYIYECNGVSNKFVVN